MLRYRLSIIEQNRLTGIGMKYVKTLGEMTREDYLEAGGKAANLSEMTQKSFNVPPGFCVTGAALEYVIENNGNYPAINEIAASLDMNDYDGMEEKTEKIRDIINGCSIPDDLMQELKDNIAGLRDKDGNDPFVAVRSSVSVKESSISSFPGMMDTYHFIKGEGEIIDYIRQCWASLWTARAASRREQQGIDHRKGVIAPVVQRMVNADVAGVLFTANPITSSRDQVVVEAVFGIGEALVSGEGVGDWFVLEKGPPPQIVERKIGNKNIMVGIDKEKGIGRKKYDLTLEQAAATTLTGEQLIQLAELGVKIEKVFEYPQDVEWAYEDGELFILQSRKVKGLRDEP